MFTMVKEAKFDVKLIPDAFPIEVSQHLSEFLACAIFVELVFSFSSDIVIEGLLFVDMMPRQRSVS